MYRFNGHRYEYRVAPWGNVTHHWELRGPEGGIHFHAIVSPTSAYGPSCGLEVHRCEPADYQKGDAPHHINCPVTGGRCWHDGTSLYATETLWPMFESWLKNGDHPMIFLRLEIEYDNHFSREDTP